MARTHQQAMAIAAFAALPHSTALLFVPSSKLPKTLPSAWSPLLRPSDRTSPIHAILDKQDTPDAFFMDEGEKVWSVKSPSKADSFQRARLAEQLRLSNASHKPKAYTKVATLPKPVMPEDATFDDFTSQLATSLDPILNPTIEKDVPPKYILGATIGGSFLTLIAATILSIPFLQSIIASVSVGIIAAYLSIIEGRSGDILREVGKYSINITEGAVEKYKEFSASLKVEKASKSTEKLSKEADRAVKKVMKAESELEAAAEKRRQALVEASEMIDSVERAKYEKAKKVRDERRRVEFEEMESRRLEEEKLWLEEQNRLAAERLQARLEKERQLAEAERLKCNPVDYDAAARLAYECSGSNDGFSTFRSKYLTDTSAMIAEKQKERVAVAKREVERLEAERLAAEEAKRLEVERLAAEEAKRREAKEAERLAAQEAKLEAERMAAEAAARAEEERRLEAEEAKRRQAEEAKRLEAERLQAEEASRMEEQKRRAEAEAAARAKAEEEASAAKREAERVMREEEARLLEEQAAAAREAVLLSGQQDVMEDDEINDDDWEASVRLANQLSGLEGFDDDDIDMDEIDELLQAEMADLTEDEEELLGKAAREAVRKYEEEMAMKRSAKQSARSAWDEQLVESSPEPEEVVEKATSGDANVDYSQMTVAELKEMLRSRGLKVGGKKSELIERLMSS